MRGKKNEEDTKEDPFLQIVAGRDCGNTLHNLCLYLDFDGRMNRRNPKAEFMREHFKQLKQASSVLRKELSEERKEE